MPRPLKPKPEFHSRDDEIFIVGDLYQTRLTLARYEVGEIFKINNFLAGSHYKNTDQTVRETESVDYSERETSSERESFSSSSSQELMRDTARSMQGKSQSIDIGGEVSGTYGMVEFSAYGDYSNTSTRQKSREQARETATRVVNESREKTTSRILSSSSRRELLVKTSTREAGIDNRLGGHVTGITLGVNEIHRVDLLNHSKHLFANVVVANPAAHYRAYLDWAGKSVSGEVKKTAKKLMYDGLEIKVQDISEENWLRYATHFDVEDAMPPPDEWISVSGKIDMQDPGTGGGHDAVITTLNVPEGYIPHRLNLSISGVVPDASRATIQAYVGGHRKGLSPWSSTSIDLQSNSDYAFKALTSGQGGNLDVGITASNHFHSGVTLDLQCKLTDTMFQLWQFDFYKSLLNAASDDADQSSVEAFDSIGVYKVDYTNNPKLAREFVLAQHKRTIMQQILGTDLEGFEVLKAPTQFPHYPKVNSKKLKALTPLVQFLDTVFDYEKMTVKYVDSHIGDLHNRKTAYEGLRPGPMKQFLEATFARVILPISRFGQNEARFRWLKATGELFIGDDVPMVDDELSMAILEELSEADDLQFRGPELVESWEISVASPHNILQADSALPNYEDPNGGPKASDVVQPSPGKD